MRFVSLGRRHAELPGGNLRLVRQRLHGNLRPLRADAQRVDGVRRRCRHHLRRIRSVHYGRRLWLRFSQMREFHRRSSDRNDVLRAGHLPAAGCRRLLCRLVVVLPARLHRQNLRRRRVRRKLWLVRPVSGVPERDVPNHGAVLRGHLLRVDEPILLYRRGRVLLRQQRRRVLPGHVLRLMGPRSMRSRRTG